MLWLFIGKDKKSLPDIVATCAIAPGFKMRARCLSDPLSLQAGEFFYFCFRRPLLLGVAHRALRFGAYAVRH